MSTVYRVLALPDGEKTLGVDVFEGMVIRVGEEFGLRTQILVTFAIQLFAGNIIVDNIQGKPCCR